MNLPFSVLARGVHYGSSAQAHARSPRCSTMPRRTRSAQGAGEWRKENQARPRNADWWEKDRRDQGETDEAYLEKLKPGSSGGGVARHATDESFTGTSVAVFFGASPRVAFRRLIGVFGFPAGEDGVFAGVGRDRVPGLVQSHDSSASGSKHIGFGIRVPFQSFVPFE